MWVALLACRAPPELADVRVETKDELPGVATVRWTTEEPGTSFVEYGEADLDRTTPETASATEHVVQVRGLQHGRTFRLRPVTVIDAERIEGEPVELEVGLARADLPVLTQTVYDPERACGEGFLLTTFLTIDGRAWVAIVDREGAPVWAWPGDGAEWLFRVKPGRDGDSLLWNHNDHLRTVDIGRITRMSFDGELLSETRTPYGHHDFVEREDGTFAWLAYEFREAYDVDGTLLDVASDAIYEGPEGAVEGEETLIFSMFEDYPHGIHDLGNPPIDTGFLPGWWEFSHGNSLLPTEDGDDYWVMFRYLDALTRIDRATGSFEWQLGGLDSDFTGPAGEEFSHAHTSQVEDDRFLLFDNADRTGGISGVAEYVYDEDARTWDRTFDYRDPNGSLEFLLGDARWMPGCDTILATFSTESRIVELTREGDVVWEIVAPTGWIVSRMTWIRDLYALAEP